MRLRVERPATSVAGSSGSQGVTSSRRSALPSSERPEGRAHDSTNEADEEADHEVEDEVARVLEGTRLAPSVRSEEPKDERNEEPRESAGRCSASAATIGSRCRETRCHRAPTLRARGRRVADLAETVGTGDETHSVKPCSTDRQNRSRA